VLERAQDGAAGFPGYGDVVAGLRQAANLDRAALAQIRRKREPTFVTSYGFVTAADIAYFLEAIDQFLIWVTWDAENGDDQGFRRDLERAIASHWPPGRREAILPP
jgi:hypothetical protein